jgi:hypothetical protein
MQCPVPCCQWHGEDLKRHLDLVLKETRVADDPHKASWIHKLAAPSTK